MKRALICIILLLTAALAWCQPMWPEEVVVRDGQDLHHFGSPVLDSSGNVLSSWVKSSGNTHSIYAMLTLPGGTTLWDNPLLIKECAAPVTDLYLLTTSDNCFIASWLEKDQNLGEQVVMQKFSSSGVLLWGQGVTVVADRIVTSYIYKIAANNSGGAYVFYHEDDENLILGRCYNSAGTEIWGTNAPSITTANGLSFSGIASNYGYGVALHYKCSSNTTNYVERYADYGYREWQQNYPFEPGESTLLHNLFVTADHKVFDVVKSIGTDQRLKVRVWGSNGTPLLNPIFELVLADNANSYIEHEVMLSGQSLQIIFQKTLGAVNEIRYYTVNGMVSQAYPPGGLLMGSNNGSVHGLKICEDNTMKYYCSWIEEHSDTDVLRVNMVNNDLEAAWGANGISLCSAQGIGNNSIIAYNATLSAHYVVYETLSKKLNKQVLNSDGSEIFITGGQTISTAITGHALNVATHRMEDRVLVFYVDIEPDGKSALFYQIISSAGYPVLAQPVQLTSYTNQRNYISSCNFSNNAVALVYYTEGAYYLQIIHYWGDHGLGEPGVLISNYIADRMEINYYNGDLYFGWMEYSGTNYKKLMGQRFSNWEKRWGPNGKTLVDNLPFMGSYISASEGPYFTWIAPEQASSPESIHCLLVDENGDPQPGWNAAGETIYDNPTDSDLRPFYAQLMGSDLIMLLGGYAPSSVYAVKVTAQHTLPWGSTGVLMAGGVTFINCAASANGLGILVDNRQNNNVELRYQKMDYAGNLLYDPAGLTLHTLAAMENINSVSLAAYANGGMLAIWTKQNITEGERLYYQTLSPAGEPVESDPQSLCSTPGFQTHPLAVALDNEAMVVWQQNRLSNAEGYDNSFSGLFAQKVNGIIASIPDEPVLVESPLLLKSAYPNPFTGSTTLLWQQKSSEPVEISVYNLKGQLVTKLSPESQGKGEHSLVWNGEDANGKKVGTGIYFLKVKSGKFSQSRKIVKI